MPQRDPSLPEGTDHIIDTNIDLGDSGASGGGSGGSGGAGGDGDSASDGKEKGSAFKFDADDGDKPEGIAAGIAGQIKDQISSFKSQATDQARSLVDDGKSQATDFLEQLADVLSDAAGSIEDKLGDRYAGPGHSAADSVRSLAGRLEDSSVEDLIAGARRFVEKSPVLAIGVAAILGFAVARVLRGSIAEFRTGGQDEDGNGSATAA